MTSVTNVFQADGVNVTASAHIRWSRNRPPRPELGQGGLTFVSLNVFVGERFVLEQLALNAGSPVDSSSNAKRTVIVSVRVLVTIVFASCRVLLVRIYTLTTGGNIVVLRLLRLYIQVNKSDAHAKPWTLLEIWSGWNITCTVENVVKSIRELSWHETKMFHHDYSVHDERSKISFRNETIRAFPFSASWAKFWNTVLKFEKSP